MSPFNANRDVCRMGIDPGGSEMKNNLLSLYSHVLFNFYLFNE